MEKAGESLTGLLDQEQSFEGDVAARGAAERAKNYSCGAALLMYVSELTTCQCLHNIVKERERGKNPGEGEGRV